MVARGAAALVTFTCVILLVVDRLELGAQHRGSVWVTSATRTSLWLVAAAIALAACQERRLSERKDGLEWLARGVGVDPGRLPWVRLRATFWLSARWSSLAPLVVGLTAVACATTLATAGKRALLVAACLVHAFVTSGLLAAVATLAEELSPKRGRSMLLVVFFVSAALAELTGVRSLSLLHVLGSLLPSMIRLVGLRVAP
jgi:hypothetical protein